MNVRQCTICAARDAGLPARVNPRLCGDCQDWDDLLHVNLCRERAGGHAPLDPVPFCYKHNPSWPPSRKSNYSALRDLEFRSAEHYASRAGTCIMCSALGNALRRAAAAATSSGGGEGDDAGNGREVKMAVWRPFIFDPSRNQWHVRDEQTAMEKGMVPWLQKCVLAICIATAPAAGFKEEGKEKEEEEEKKKKEEEAGKKEEKEEEEEKKKKEEEAGKKEEKEEDSWTYEPKILEFVLRYEKWCYDLSQISPWERGVMDMGQITTWLDRCVREHHEECGTPWIPTTVSLPRGFRLIDARERRVVLPQSGVAYVALSYVWNAASASPERQKLQLCSENIEQLEQVDSLADSILPEVVSDAIHLCNEIGQRYLWVDRFCIVQDDLDLKAEQIDAMGVIYDRAFLTFVALGDGPTPGLVGLTCRPRQQGFQNLSWDLLPTMSNPVGEARVPLIDMAISESRWDDRAWTFQERALSKRRIYFDAGQVYGNCTKEKWQERPRDIGETQWKKTEPWEMGELQERSWISGVDSFATYSGVVTQFSPRKLTFPEDVLRAFAGIANVLETKLQRPILLGHPEEFFTESLRWVPQPGFMVARRVLDNVPSWSWASWDGRATWDKDWTIAPGIFLGNGMSEVKASFVKFYVSDPKEGLRPVKERHLSLEDYLVSQKRSALKVLKEAATSWWPSSILDDPMTIGAGGIEELTDQVWNFARQKAQGDDAAHRWPPSTAGTPRSERLHDLSEDMTAFAALRNLEEHTDTQWWPPTAAKESEASQKFGSLCKNASTLAEGKPNSIVFNTTCAYLKIGPFGRMWYRIPPRRHLSGCVIQNENGIPVGITMAMAPQLTFNVFKKGRECLVALLGVCSSKRYMQWDKGERSRLPIHHLNELCLLVMILEEKDDVCNRLAVGVVYPDEWMKVKPQWRSVVVT